MKPSIYWPISGPKYETVNFHWLSPPATPLFAHPIRSKIVRRSKPLGTNRGSLARMASRTPSTPPSPSSVGPIKCDASCARLAPRTWCGCTLRRRPRRTPTDLRMKCVWPSSNSGMAWASRQTRRLLPRVWNSDGGWLWVSLRPELGHKWIRWLKCHVKLQSVCTNEILIGFTQ